MHQQKCWCIFILCRYLEYPKPKEGEIMQSYEQQMFTHQLVVSILDTIRNVEGSALVGSLDKTLEDHDQFLRTTPIPEHVADWLDNLIELMNNCEGAELARELKNLKQPTRKEVSNAK
jgi:hypothetical protein